MATMATTDRRPVPEVVYAAAVAVLLRRATAAELVAVAEYLPGSSAPARELAVAVFERAAANGVLVELRG